MTQASPALLPSDRQDLVSTRLWRGGMVALAVCLAASLLLVLQHFGRLSLPGCAPGSSCDIAARSAWGAVGGWPVSFVGLAYFLGVLVAWIRIGNRGIPATLRWIVRLGAVISVVYLLVIFLHHYYCSYCLVTHAANLSFWVVVERMRRSDEAWYGSAVTVTVTFALVSASLNVAVSEQERFARERAEYQLQQSVETVVANFRSQQGIGSGIGAANANNTDAADLSGDDAGVTPSAAPQHNDDQAGRPFPLGPGDAEIRLEIFYDYQCQHCQRIDRDIQTLFSRYGDIMSVTVRHFPLCTECNFNITSNLHPEACRAARAVEAAGLLQGKDGFWKLNAWLFNQKGSFTDQQLAEALPGLGFDDVELFLETMAGKEVLRGILSDVVDGESRNVTITPTIYINDVQLAGWYAEAAVVRAVTKIAEQQALSSTDRLSMSLAEEPAPDDFSQQLQRSAAMATVRLLNKSNSRTDEIVGSGVVIGFRSPFSYVLTAYHNLIGVEYLEIQTFSSESYPDPLRTYRATVMLASLPTQDLALLRIATDDPPPSTLQICPPQLVPDEQRFSVMTVGCNGLAAPTCRFGLLDGEKKLIRRQEGETGVSVWELQEAQPSGRSGGPLTDNRGYVLGVASGTASGKSYFCHIDVIHEFLTKQGLKWLFRVEPSATGRSENARSEGR